MKLNRRYECAIEKDGPKLVDVTELGETEGFNDTEELKEAVESAAVYLGDRAEKFLPQVEALIRRLEEGKLNPEDVLDAKHRPF